MFAVGSCLLPSNTLQHPPASCVHSRLSRIGCHEHTLNPKPSCRGRRGRSVHPKMQNCALSRFLFTTLQHPTTPSDTLQHHPTPSTTLQHPKHLPSNPLAEAEEAEACAPKRLTEFWGSYSAPDNIAESYGAAAGVFWWNTYLFPHALITLLCPAGVLRSSATAHPLNHHRVLGMVLL